MKISDVSAELFHVGGQTDRYDEANSGFPQFYEKRPKSEHTNYYLVYFLLGNSPASEFYIPTFRNTLSVPSS